MIASLAQITPGMVDASCWIIITTTIFIALIINIIVISKKPGPRILYVMELYFSYTFCILSFIFSIVFISWLVKLLIV